jgi:RNA polymerase sigma factor (sigma-70 family)
MPSDHELVRLAARGNADAFRRLVDDHQRLVAHVVFRMVPDTGDREDLCQEVFIRVYQKLRTFRFQSKLSTWIARVAYTVCLNHLAKKRIETTMDRIDVEEMEGDRGHPLGLDSADTGNEEMRAFVRTRVQELPLPYRVAVTLHYLEDMTVQEIGELMEIPAGTVKSHLFRARAMLRRDLVARYGAEELHT